jgi:mannose-6-phosphate isomerase-like protein (cupin superfamily)
MSAGLIRLDDIEARRLDVAPVDVKRILGGRSAQLAVTWMSIDGSHPKVVLHGADTLYCVLSGTASFVVDDVPAVVDAGEFMFVPADVSYSYSGTFRYLVVQAPPLAPDAIEFLDHT